MIGRRRQAALRIDVRASGQLAEIMDKLLPIGNTVPASNPSFGRPTPNQTFQQHAPQPLCSPGFASPFSRAPGFDVDKGHRVGEELLLRAIRQGGEMLAEMESAQGRRSDLVTSRDQVGGPPTLSDLGISRKQSSRWQAATNKTGPGSFQPRPALATRAVTVVGREPGLPS